MKVSILIPAYNASNTILFVLDKLRGQSFSDFEAIIVNDGSSDNTKQIVENFIRKNNLNWQLINQENKGEGEARNTALRYAKGEYVLFLDADDYLDNRALEKLVNALENNGADLVFSSYSYCYGDGKQKLYYHPNKIYNQEEIMKLFFRRLANPGIGNTLINKNIIDIHNIRFENYKAGADNHFFRKILLYVINVASINDNLFFYVYNDNSVMNNAYSFNRLDSIHSVVNSINEYKNNDMPEDIIAYLNIFLINEIKGNSIDFYLSNKDEKELKEKILHYMPKSVSIFKFISNKRSLWLFSLYIFYKIPILSIKMYLQLKGKK